ncbi:hypothetical protein WICPIJ_007009 [Wickerhamomyces pijperi]|uniref:Kri1-like C-terminal domain-containing protein n=1 Tax=Wickerhamomyces pijperi TaxID=599730 RepID=A0A9P8Q2Q3_WICPI|nr:hypothetical protein WICPIJ_007009 [Wickerhamomyces pijperi]
MARKKSATKLAREAEEKAKAEQLSKLSPEELKELEEDEEVEKKIQKQVQEEFDSEVDSETSEEEDDFGELITEDVEEGFTKVLEAIKKNDKALFDPNVRFFSDEVGTAESKDPKQKPIYLKDYHRMNLLSGDALKEIDEIHDENAPKTYAQEREEERNELLSDIKKAFDDVDENEDEEDEDDDGFMLKKTATEGQAPTRVLPDPTKDEEQFLQEFANQQAWIPHQGDKIIDLDGTEKDDEEFDDAADKFENAYNFRYEDANSAEIVSYARTQATVRRNELNGRRKKREEERAAKQEKKKQKEKLISKKTTEKINKLADILEQVKKEYGADLSEDLVKKLTDSLLNKDFDDSKWDEVLSEVFNDEFYNGDSGKPTWDDDDELMGGEYDDDDEEHTEDFEQEGTNEDADEEEKDEESEEPPKKKSKKDQHKEKKSAKKEKKEIKDLAEKAIQQNKLKIIDSVEEEEPERGRSKDKSEVKFRYREVSPESFGLTTREILIADDGELNEFIGLKKFAPYRPKEQRMKDKRKYAKSKHLKEWRKKVFHNENGPEVENENEIVIPLDRKSTVELSNKKSKKRKNNKN